MSQLFKTEKIPSLAEQFRVAGEAFWNMKEKYNLLQKDAALLLGVKASGRASLAKYEKTKTIPDNEDTLLRVGILLGIHKSLRIIYPENSSLRYGWFHQPFDELGDEMTPLEYLKTSEPAQRLLRMQNVRALLDRVRIHG